LNKRTLVDLTGLIFLVAVVALGYHFSPLILPQADLVVKPSDECRLDRQSCEVALPDGGHMTVSLLPRPVPMMKPFSVEVRVQSMSLESVEIDFSGVDMNMGLNRFSLKDQGQGIWLAEATIPICVTGQMAWQATVMLRRGQQQIAVPFHFESGGPTP
jgi:hypothetical protein